MEASGAKQPSYVNRGDPVAQDWNVGTFGHDGTWNTLDLSGVVPAGCKAVTIWIMYMATAVANTLQFRTLGNTNAVNMASIKVPVAMGTHYAQLTLIPDSDGKVEAKGTAANWITLDIGISGWVP